MGSGDGKPAAATAPVPRGAQQFTTAYPPPPVPPAGGTGPVQQKQSGPDLYPPAPLPVGEASSAPARDFWSDKSPQQASGYPPAAYGTGTYGVTQGNVSYPSVGYPGASPSHASGPYNESHKPGEPRDTVVLMHGAKPGDRPTGNTQDAPYTPTRGYDERPSRPPAAMGVAYPPHERGWSDELRRGFIRKVLLLVFVQLLITTGISVAFFTVDPIQDFVHNNAWLIWVCLLISFAMLFTVACVPKARKYPFDYMLLFGFTLFFSVCVGAITAQYDVDAVAIALGVTAACVFGAFFVAAFTPLDLTKIGGFLVAILFGVIVMSILAIFIRSKWFHFAIALVAAILFTVFLIYDLQMLMGGRSNEFSPDDYVIAALNIYIDIVQIFLNVLQLIGILGSD